MSVEYYYHKPDADVHEDGPAAAVRVVAVNLFYNSGSDSLVDLASARRICERTAIEVCAGRATHLSAHGMEQIVLSGKDAAPGVLEELQRSLKLNAYGERLSIWLGCSGIVEGMERVAAAIHQAVCAEQHGALRQQDTVRFEELPYSVEVPAETMYLNDYFAINHRLLELNGPNICREVFARLDAMASSVPAYVCFSFARKCAEDVCWMVEERKRTCEGGAKLDALSSAFSMDLLKARFEAAVRDSVRLFEHRSAVIGTSAIERAVRYIDLHYMDVVGASEVAKQFYIDPTYFSNLFKKTTGKNYNRYITDLRMERSRTLLLSGKLVSDVAGLVGYQSVRHFSKLFRQHAGVLPSDINTKKRTEFT